MEIELKLLVDAQGAKALQRHPLLKKYAVSAPHRLNMSDTYFDTPDLLIRSSGSGVRVRRVNGKWVQTLKSGGSVNGGLHSRNEWESPLAGSVPDLAVLAAMVGHHTDLGRLLDSPDLRERLAPIFSTRIKRRLWECRLPHGDLVECVLDLGHVQCNDRNVPISEIELEIKSGDPLHLFDFALALLEDIPMRVGHLSKTDRGYALFAQLPQSAVKAMPIKLSRRMTVEDAFAAIADNCLTQMQANAICVSQQHDVEGLHQMRVGLRRLYCALDVFNGTLRTPKWMLHELDWLADQLGAARDWDVLVGCTLPIVAEALPEQTQIAEVMLVAQHRADEQYAVASAAIRSTRYTVLILRLTRWLLGFRWRVGLSHNARRQLATRLERFSRKVLAHLQRRLRKRGRRLKGASQKARHRVRIAAKNTRYTLEFFQSLLPAKKSRPFVDALSNLQDELGWLNDAAVAGGLLNELQGGHVHLAPTSSVIQSYLTACSKKDNKKLRKSWKRFSAMQMGW